VKERAAAERRPVPRFYSLGAHAVYWGYGVNRFLNYGTPGQDLANLSNELPILDNDDHDMVFMVWPGNAQYLSVLRAYYPDGIEAPFDYGRPNPTPLFISYLVRKEQVDGRRIVLATYVPATGPPVERREAGFGAAATPLPKGMTYPVSARWEGNLIVPAYGFYRFHAESATGAALFLDGARVPLDGPVVLSRGVHEVRLRGTLADDRARIVLRWSPAGKELETIDRRFLWTGPGRAFAGVIRPLGKVSPARTAGESDLPKATQRRIDGFLGFRDTAVAVGEPGPFVGTWTGRLTVSHSGLHGFRVFSTGETTLSIDGVVVVDNRHGGVSPTGADGTSNLSAGAHAIELLYVSTTERPLLEVYWEPPGGVRSILGPGVVNTDGGLWSPDPAGAGVRAGGGKGRRDGR
jgi:hypothetical protein